MVQRVEEYDSIWRIVALSSVDLILREFFFWTAAELKHRYYEFQFFNSK